MAFQFSAEAVKRITDIKAQYPDPRSAVMSALYLVQEEEGKISQDGVEWVAQQIGLPPIQVWEVATFYSMYYKKNVGRYHFQICRTLPCALCGARKISAALHKRFGIGPGEVSRDGMWSYEEVECLGSCGTAPVCEINDHYFENLTPEKIEAIIERISSEKPDLRFSTKKDDMGTGFTK